MNKPFSLGQADVCRTQEELFESKTLARLLKMYNHKNDIDIEPGDLKRDYALATQLDGFFSRLEVSGRIQTIVEIDALRKRVLSHIRAVDTSRVVPHYECNQRLEKISPQLNLNAALNSGREFYHKTGLTKKDPDTAPVTYLWPQIREGAIGAFEQIAHRGVRTNLLYIDDARFTDLETVDHFFPGKQRNVEKLRKMLSASRSLHPGQLQKLVEQSAEIETDEQMIELFRQAYQKAPVNYSGHEHFLAYSRDPEMAPNKSRHPAQSFLDTFSTATSPSLTSYIGKKSVAAPTVGQYLRLSRFLKQNSPEDYSRFHHRELEYMTIDLCTPLNHVLPNGKVLSLRGDRAGNIRVFAVNPREPIPNQKARPLYLGE